MQVRPRAKCCGEGREYRLGVAISLTMLSACPVTPQACGEGRSKCKWKKGSINRKATGWGDANINVSAGEKREKQKARERCKTCPSDGVGNSPSGR